MTRGKYQGMLAIVRFNWPMYAAALLVLILSAVGMTLDIAAWRWVCALAFAASGYFFIGSLGVSHLVYDRSDLHRFRWLERVLDGHRGGRHVICHSGFDEVSTAMSALRPDATWTTVDHFDAALMTEASIHRARKLFPPVPDAVAAPFNRWPLDTASCDVVFGLLAIHELRDHADRLAWFEEARRCLAPGGRVVLAEHLRDPANFLAFGPGFLHFHAESTWKRAWYAAGFRVSDQFRLTPWVKFYVLQ